MMTGNHSVLDAYPQLLGNLGNEISNPLLHHGEYLMLEGALVASIQPSPFKLENFRLPEGAKLAANCCRIMAHSQQLIQAFIRRQLAGETPFRTTARRPALYGPAATAAV